MQRLIWPTVFLTACPATLLATFLVLGSLTPTISAAPPDPLPLPQVLSASTETPATLTSSLTIIDGRPLILQKYLSQHHSVLEPLSSDLVQLSDKYGIDYRLLVAIARQESNLCKRIPPNSNNCWGHGIWGDKVTRYPTLLVGAEAVLKTLVKYQRDGLHTPEEIMRRYTPPSTGSWAAGVNQFLAELD